MHGAENRGAANRSLRPVRKGSPPEIPRHLDHGVCGGLLLLKYSTWWFKTFFTPPPLRPTAGSVQKMVKNKIEAAKEGKSYYVAPWWTSVVWATAAVALHNVQQNP